MHSIETVLVVAEPAQAICGVLHLDVAGGGAVLGLSVSGWARGKGVGTLLLERARTLACARGVTTFFVRNLKHMPALMRLAHHVGMNVICKPGASANRWESSASDDGVQQHDAVSANITLADYDLRFHLNGSPCIVSARVEAARQSGRRQLARRVEERTGPRHRAGHQAARKTLSDQENANLGEGVAGYRVSTPQRSSFIA